MTGRFFNEARAANAIRHPNIIEVLDLGTIPQLGVPFLIVEYLDGESLARRLERTGRQQIVRPLPSRVVAGEGVG